VTTAACGGNGGAGDNPGNKNTTLITVLHNSGSAASTQWWVEANKRFVDLKKDEVYDEGTKGVRIDVKTSNVNDQDTYAQDVIISENNVNMYRLAAEGQGFADRRYRCRIRKHNRSRYERKNEGRRRALLFYAALFGLRQYELQQKHIRRVQPLFCRSRRRRRFGCKKGRANICLIPTVSFMPTAQSGAKQDSLRMQTPKNPAGPTANTVRPDDGLPSSLEELLVLCDKMTSNSGSKKVNPFTLSSESTVYSFFLLDTLWASLAGADAMKNIYCDWNDAQVELVTGYTNEDLFYAGSGIKKPTTEFVTLNDENGYRMYDMAAEILFSRYSRNSLQKRMDFHENQLDHHPVGFRLRR